MNQEPAPDDIRLFHFGPQTHLHNSCLPSTREHRSSAANRTCKFRRRRHRCCWIHCLQICLSCWRSLRCFWAKIRQSFDMKQHLLLLSMSNSYPMTMACSELQYLRCGHWGARYRRRGCLKHTRRHNWGWWSGQSHCRRISNLILYCWRMIPLIANSLKRWRARRRGSLCPWSHHAGLSILIFLDAVDQRTCCCLSWLDLSRC